jgi:hypothetical protein
MGASSRAPGFCAGWSSFSWVERRHDHLGARRAPGVDWSFVPQKGSRGSSRGLMANRPSSQMTWLAMSKPIRLETRGHLPWSPACQT